MRGTYVKEESQRKGWRKVQKEMGDKVRRGEGGGKKEDKWKRGLKQDIEAC